jgi:carbamoyl-phosphate synthase large subunit
VRGGEVARGVTINDPDIAAVVAGLVHHLNPTGPVTVQGMYDGGTFKVTECNARMGGGLPLAVAAGVPVADLLARSWAGEHVEPVSTYATGVVMARFDDSFFVHP